MSAALKKGELNAEGYARMIETTTRLNTPGPDLAALPGVHALTAVSGHVQSTATGHQPYLTVR